MWPPKYEKHPLFGKESPRTGEHLYRFFGFICTFIGIFVSNLIIAYALIDTSVDFATVQT